MGNEAFKITEAYGGYKIDIGIFRYYTITDEWYNLRDSPGSGSCEEPKHLRIIVLLFGSYSKKHRWTWDLLRS